MPSKLQTSDAWELERSILLRDVATGPYTDHLTVDSRRHRVFGTMQASHQVSVADYRTGEVFQSIPDIGNPHGIFFNVLLDRLFVTDSVAHAVRIYDGDDYSLIKNISTGGGEDGIATDPKDARYLYVANGGHNAGETSSRLTLIDMESLDIISQIPIQTATLEESVVDPRARRIYACAANEHSILVIDQDSGGCLDTWHLPDSKLVMSLALDSPRNRIFAGSRNTSRRGSLVEVDTTNGDIYGWWSAGGWIDNLWVDSKRNRVFVSSGIGEVQTWHIEENGELSSLSPVDTSVMAKTCYYSSSVDRLFVAVPHLGFPWEYARILVFKPVG